MVLIHRALSPQSPGATPLAPAQARPGWPGYPQSPMSGAQVSSPYTSTSQAQFALYSPAQAGHSPRTQPLSTPKQFSPQLPSEALGASLAVFSASPGNSVMVSATGFSGASTPALNYRQVDPHSARPASSPEKAAASTPTRLELGTPGQGPQTPSISPKSIQSSPAGKQSPRPLVGAPFEKSPVSAQKRSSRLQQRQPAKTPTSQGGPGTDGARTPSVATPSAGFGVASPRDRRPTSTARISQTASRASLASTWDGGRSATLRRCRSADDRGPRAPSIGTRSFDSVSWEAESQLGAGTNASASRRSRGSPRGRASFSTPRCNSSRLSTGALSALSSATLDKERRIMEKSLEREHRWLRRALSEEMRKVTQQEAASEAARQRFEEHQERERTQEERRVEKCRKDWEKSCQQKREQELRQKKDAENKREAFEQSCAELQEQRHQELQRQEELKAKRLREAQRHLELEAQLEARREEEKRRMEYRRQLNEDLNRTRDAIVARQRELSQEQREVRKEAREIRAGNAWAKSDQHHQDRRDRHERKLQQLQEGEEQWTARQHQKQDELRQSAMSLANKRQEAYNIATKKATDRQRTIHEQVIHKDDKLTALEAERQKIWEMRRMAQTEARRILRSARTESQRSSQNSRQYLKWLTEQLDRIQNPSALMSSSASGNDLASSSSLSAVHFPEDYLSEHRAAGVDPAAERLPNGP
eukprot:TRINITY_DN5404_c3_g1_i1.p1 TRINITY_DN5404_c3_g1~~TRINITY_DN5404_c3_g1_i1.p1  ORF type:complete len:706 (-),score=139.77 TRINITY_DN5404_c3_g1_i1:248-2365(-)